jgi:Flp pilus assembly protein TadD
VPGLKVHLEPVRGGARVTLRTFSDGGFYAFGLMPGRYRVSLDSVQLAALDVRAEPPTQELEVRSLSEAASAEVRFALEPGARAVPAELVVHAPHRGRGDAGLLRESAADAVARGDLALAIELHHRLLRLDPDDGAAFEELARLYRASGDLERAREAYRRVIDLEPGAHGVRRDLGLVLVALGDRVEARAVLRAALSENPDDPAVRAALEALEED